jgi:type I restriction enzyme M protein
VGGRCAFVVPDNVLFEGGAGETVRRRLLNQSEVHTLLRLPTGIWYSPGVKANVLFFDKRPGREEAWTRELWVYDLRTNTHFTLKKDPLRRHHLDEFVSLYHPENRHERTSTWSEENPEGRWRPYTYEEILRREGANLDLSWIRDKSLEDSADLEDPDTIAEEIADDLQAALEQFATIAADLRQRE